MRDPRLTPVDRMRELRIAAGLTQKEAAEAFYLTEREYRYYESGKCEPSLVVLKDVVEFYQIDMLLLLEGKIGGDKNILEIAIKKKYDNKILEQLLELAENLSQWQLALAMTYMRRFQTPGSQEEKSHA